MGRRFAELAFTPLVKEQQEQHGSRHLYERVEQSLDLGDRLGEAEQAFIGERDGFYMASVTETGWPYVQYRGGPVGFLHVLDERTIGFADLQGQQAIHQHGKSSARRSRCLIPDGLSEPKPIEDSGASQNSRRGCGSTKAHRNSSNARREGRRSNALLLIRVEAFDWNCPQHITPRYSERELGEDSGTDAASPRGT